MKYLKIVIVVLFILSVGVFGYSECEKRFGRDNVSPVISGSSEMLELKKGYTQEDLLEGLTASDDKDGDLTDKIMIGNTSRFHSLGRFKVTYVVFDAANNPATFSREVKIVDYTSPTFTLSDPLVYVVGKTRNDYTELGASDVIDGDISSSIRITDTNVNFKTIGDYRINVECSNSFGDIQAVSLPVHIVDTMDLMITINLTQNLVYVNKGSTFDPKKYLDSVEPIYGIDISKDKVKIDSQVNTDKEGCYEVKYTVDGVSGFKGTAWLTVVVR